MPRGSHGSPCSMALANASVVASIRSKVVGPSRRSSAATSLMMARARLALSGAGGSHASWVIHLGYSRPRSGLHARSVLDALEGARLTREKAERQHGCGQDRAADEHRLRARG